MAGNIEIDFQEIRPHEGDKRKGFEELVCQLARREKDLGAGEFRRVEGAGGEGGIKQSIFLLPSTLIGLKSTNQ